MNCGGAIAQQRWKRWRPAIYAAIGDPGTYFTKLGEQAGNTCRISPPASPRPSPIPDSLTVSRLTHGVSLVTWRLSSINHFLGCSLPALCSGA